LNVEHCGVSVSKLYSEAWMLWFTSDQLSGQSVRSQAQGGLSVTVCRRGLSQLQRMHGLS